VVTDLELLAPEGLRQRHHAFIIGVPENDRAVVTEEVDDRSDLAARDIARRLDHVERLVEHDVLTFLELEGVEVGMRVHPHRPAVHDDLGGTVLIGPLEDSVVVGRRAQLVDLFLQELDLLFRLLEHADEALVLALGVGALLASEMIAPAQRLELGHQAIQPPAKLGRVDSEQSNRVLQILDAFLVRASGRALAAHLSGLILVVARTRRRDPPHDIPHETLSARA
jgi:hypothetical protein